jgi:predicted nucleic acid-binding protein
VYIEEYGLACKLGLADALIAATGAESGNLVLVTGNEKHYKVIPDIELKIFHP